MVIFSVILSIVFTFEVQSEKPNSELSIMYSKREPFVIESQLKNKPSGLDVSIVENFARKMKLKTEYMYSTASLNLAFLTDESFEKFRTNHSIDEIDVFIGGLSQNLFTEKQFEASHAYYQDSLTWCFAAKKPIPLWKNIFIGVSDDRVFIVMLITAFVVISTGYVIQLFEDEHPIKWDWHRITTVGFANSSGMSYPYEPKIAANRVFYGCCLFAGLIYSTVIGTYFLPLMAFPVYEDQIGSIEEIMTNDYKFIGDEFAWGQLKTLNEASRKVSDRFGICENVDVCLKQLATNDYLAVAISLEHARHSRFMPMSEIYCFENTQQIVQHSTHVLVRKDFHLFDELNAFIDAARANGLISKWLDRTKIRPDFRYPDDGDGQITMDNFIGFFGLWFCLLFIPSTIFLIEKCSFHWAHKPNPTKVSILLEMYIDADRHFLLNNIDLTRRKMRTPRWI